MLMAFVADATSPSDLVDQVHDRLDLSASTSRLSYRSRPISPTSSFTDARIPNYATLDLSLRLPGGGPKKRCAYSFVKPGTVISATKAPTTLKEAVVTPAPAPVASTSAVVEGSSDETKEGEASVEVPPVAQEPVMERCTSAALVRFLLQCSVNTG